jgi:long-chain acyl-CoA synthetase
VPRSVLVRRERLPLSGAGKVLKSELRAPYWAARGSRI